MALCTDPRSRTRADMQLPSPSLAASPHPPTAASSPRPHLHRHAAVPHLPVLCACPPAAEPEPNARAHRYLHQSHTLPLLGALAYRRCTACRRTFPCTYTMPVAIPPSCLHFPARATPRHSAHTDMCPLLKARIRTAGDAAPDRRTFSCTGTAPAAIPPRACVRSAPRANVTRRRTSDRTGAPGDAGAPDTQRPGGETRPHTVWQSTLPAGATLSVGKPDGEHNMRAAGENTTSQNPVPERSAPLRSPW
ncbi:hypothetical protein C8R46DRAFT_1213492 [Mycena filopes]|nr:hypothetical protein C8R46DRAFT_1213492 [Mycena filopes]